jgi:hypothetical protein
MKTHDMRRSDREKKAERERYMVGPINEGADYAHGLHVRLSEPELARIGIDGMPKVGDTYRVEGEMKVVSAEGRDSENAPSTREVTCVLQRLGAEPKGNGREQSDVREDLEKARHQASGTTAGQGRIGARLDC